MAANRPRKPLRSGGAGAGRRGIGPDDRALWDVVTRDILPLASAGRSADRTSDPDAARPHENTRATTPAKPALSRSPNKPHVVRTAGASSARQGRPPAVSFDLADPVVTQVGSPEPGLDRRNAARLRRGERTPDGRIDLHGMTTSRAHRALDRRIGEALARGERVVLVITGKGSRRRHEEDAPFMRENTGVLRQQAPRWLLGGPHSNRIVGIYQAHPRHGGTGAFYVYLKKLR